MPFELNHRLRKPGVGVEVATGRGERIKRWFHRNRSHERSLGINARAVLFADSRSGWSAVQLTVSLIWWSCTLYPIRWRNPPREEFRVVTLAEQVRETHRRELRVVTVEDDAEAREAEEQRILREREKAIMDEIRRRSEGESMH